MGKGQISYGAGNWFTAYRTEGNPAVRKMLAGFISTLLPKPEQLLWVENKPLRVETSLMRNRHGCVAGLVDSAIQEQSTRFVHVEELTPALNLPVTVRIAEKVRVIGAHPIEPRREKS